MELVQKYTNLFHWAMNQFNNIPPSIEPTATGHIVEQIEMIKQIIAAGYAYEVNGSVYFDVKKYAANYPYGKMSGRVIDDLLETTRLLEGKMKSVTSRILLFGKRPRLNTLCAGKARGAKVSRLAH